MAASRIEPGFDNQPDLAGRGAGHGLAPDLSKVLIVGNSQITRIVVARIVERSALKPVCEQPASAVRVLPLLFPGLAILDGGAEDRDCDGLVAGITALRRVSGGRLPAVVLISSRTIHPQGSPVADLADAVVTKPFTTEQLQPVVDRLLAQAGGDRQ
jgi:CheY-like chemotaxis protein